MHIKHMVGRTEKQDTKKQDTKKQDFVGVCRGLLAAAAFTVVGLGTASSASAITMVQPNVNLYGDADLLGFANDDFSLATQGAALTGLASGQVSLSTTVRRHSFPFDPEPSDGFGTDRIYTAAGQSAFGDGYSSHAGRTQGPLNVSLDYGSLIESGALIETLTLGIGADDFQNPVFFQEFSASVNGNQNKTISNQLNALNQTGPVTQFFSVGINPDHLNPDNSLSLVIEQVDDGRDGWAVDFFTIGVTTREVPTPALLPGLIGIGAAALRKRRQESAS